VSVQGADTAKSQLSDVGKSADNVSGGFGNMLKQGLANAAGFAVFNVGAKAVGFLKDQFADTLQVAIQHQQIMSQTAQVIKSTGDASGMTAQSISDLAMSLSKVTPFSDDVIQSGQNILLTFTGIGKDVFPQTTKTMLDMAQAMGMDTKSAAMQLGKALNDPAQGLSALSREGVTFSEKQKEMIKHMVAVGNTAGAQKIMLAELQKEFGGSAQAAGKTFGGQLQILKNNLEDVKQKIGTALLPILGQFTGWISSSAMPLISGFGAAVGNAMSYVGDVLRTVNLSDFIDAWKTIQTEAGYVARKFGDLFNAASPLGNILSQVGSDFDPIADAIQKLAQGALDKVSGLLWDISGAFIAVTKQTQSGKGPLIDIFHAFSNIANLLKGELGKELKDLGKDAQQVGQWFMSSVVPAIKQALPGFENLGKTILTTVIPAVIQIRGIFVDVIQHAFEKFAPIIEKIVPPLIKFAGVLANDISNGLKFIMPYVLQAAHAIGDFAKGLMDRVAPIVSQAFGNIMQAVKFFWSMWMVVWPGVSQILKGVWDEAVGIIKIAWSIITGIINIGLDLISGNWGQAWNDMLSMFGGIWDGMKSMLSGAWGIIKGLFTTIVDEIIGFFTFLWDKLTGHSIIPDMINDIVSWFSQLPGRALAFVENLVTNMTNTLGGLGAKALTWAGDMINQFVQGILNGVGAVGNAVSKIADKISSFLHFSKPDVGPLVDVDNWMPDFGDLLSKGLANQVSKIQAPALQLASVMAMSISPLQGGLTALPAGARAIPSSIASQSSASRGGEIHIHNYIDGKEITNNVGPRIIKTTRTSGPIRSNV
jgi:phage-related protein